jgi:hypothetical protein
MHHCRKTTQWDANMPRYRTNEFATVPKGQRVAAISNARVNRARAAAAEILRYTLRDVPPVNVAQRDTATRVMRTSIAHDRAGTTGYGGRR